MKTKAFFRKEAENKKITAQEVMQSYMMERLLERIFLSPYKNNFILKGGFLISHLVGLNYRTTMDIDTTAKGITINEETIESILEKICEIDIGDDVIFEMRSIEEIRAGDSYPGFRVLLYAKLFTIKVQIKVDITTGDIITYNEIEQTFPLLLVERKLTILSYNIETILAEKIETILSRGIKNTRIRDYYDIYILSFLFDKEVKYLILKEALTRTVTKRNSNIILKSYHEIIFEINESDQLKKAWNRYAKKYNYAKEIQFDLICEKIVKLLDSCFED